MFVYERCSRLPFRAAAIASPLVCLTPGGAMRHTQSKEKSATGTPEQNAASGHDASPFLSSPATLPDGEGMILIPLSLQSCTRG